MSSNGLNGGSAPPAEMLVEFPCDFPMTVIGDADDGFVDRVVEVIEAMTRGFDRETVVTKPSRAGRYVSVRFEVWVTSKEQLDALYRRLHGLEGVRFLL